MNYCKKNYNPSEIRVKILVSLNTVKLYCWGIHF